MIQEARRVILNSGRTAKCTHCPRLTDGRCTVCRKPVVSGLPPVTSTTVTTVTVTHTVTTTTVTLQADTLPDINVMIEVTIPSVFFGVFLGVLFAWRTKK